MELCFEIRDNNQTKVSRKILWHFYSQNYKMEQNFGRKQKNSRFEHQNNIQTVFSPSIFLLIFGLGAVELSVRYEGSCSARAEVLLLVQDEGLETLAVQGLEIWSIFVWKLVYTKFFKLHYQFFPVPVQIFAVNAPTQD